MSTILNALKRLEEERREAKIPQTPRSMTGQSGRRRLFTLKAGLTVTVLAFVLGSAVWVWLNGGLPGRRLSGKAAVLEPPAAVVASDTTEERSHDDEETANQATATAEREEPTQPFSFRTATAPEVVRPSAPVGRPTVPPVYSKDLQARPRPTKPSPDRSRNGRWYDFPDDAAEQPLPLKVLNTDPLQSAPQTTKPPQTANDQQPPFTPGPSRETEPLARGTLTLQAISWADVPGARLTIIDGRILREGETVDGFTVIQIRPEKVILGKDGKRWRLTYGNR